MATTTNYSWNTPDNTAYVKDGASAIRTLGSSVDTTLFTALGGAYPGLRLIKKQTIGTAVSSVNVTGAFSSTYDNYKIVISSGVASAGCSLLTRLGASVTGYTVGVNYMTFGAATALATSDTSTSWTFGGQGTTNFLALDLDLVNPFLTKFTLMRGPFLNATQGGSVTGFHSVAASYTDFTITPSTGTLTGGTIYVYGYGAS